MDDTKLKIKISHVPGLKEIVLEELNEFGAFNVVDEDRNSVYIDYIEDFEILRKLRSASRVYLITQNKKYNPLYISNHKSILGDLLSVVLEKNPKKSFKTFRIYCAGSATSEVSEIKEYILEHYSLKPSNEADMKVHIIKIGDTWEIGVQITPRPLSLREYKVKNVSGAMDPTLAYALNSLCDLNKYSSYLNVFSGSATLMIEAGLHFENLEKIMGFDINKDYLSLSIQNIKKAGLIQKAKIKEADIFNKPDFGKFDVITSDLPFGMAISKDEDLEKLYKIFIEYCDNYLNDDGKLGVYTSEFKMFEKLITKSNFKLKQEVKIDLITSEEQYLPVKIMVFNRA